MAYEYSFYTGQGGNGGPTVLSGATPEELKKNYINWAVTNRANIGLPGFAGSLQSVGGTAPSLSDDELRAVYAASTNKATPEQMTLLNTAMGKAAPATSLNPDYTAAGVQAGLGVSPFEGGKTTSNTGQAVPMGYNQQQGAPSENPAYPQQLKAISSSTTSGTPAGTTAANMPQLPPTPTYTSGTYSGGAPRTGGGTSAPPPAYQPQTYNAPAPQPVKYNGPSYQIQPYQAPQYEPVNLDQYFQQYSQYLTPSEQETGIKQTINDLMASYRAGLTNVEGQPIAMGFVTGQSAALDRQAEMEKANLLDALGLAQGNRLAMGDVARAQYEFANAEAIRRQNASENAFNQWSTTQQLQMANAKQGFDQWAAEQGLSQDAANQAFNQWATQQGLNMQASGQAYDQWLGGQQLANQQSAQNFDQWLAQQQLGLQTQQLNQNAQQQAYQNAFQQQGFSADEAYRQAQLQLQRDQLAQQNSQFNANLTADQQAAQTMTPYQQEQIKLQQQSQVADLQQQLYNMQKPQEVTGGNSLMSPSGTVLGTAPKSYASTSAPATTPTSTPTATAPTSSYSGGSIVDYLNSVGQPSDYASRARLAAQLGIQNYTGTAEQNTQLLQLLRNSGTASTMQPYFGVRTPVDTTIRSTTGRTI